MTRVAITTDRYRLAASCYDHAGLVPVPVPCVRVDRSEAPVLARIRRAAAGADLILLTSKRALEILWPEGTMPDVPVAAVGERTAAAVLGRGGRVALTGRSGLAAFIDDLTTLSAPKRVVFPHAAGTDPDLLDGLRLRLPGLQEFEAYRTVAVPPSAAEVEAVAFASPSAVDGWHLSRTLDGLAVGVIGPTTAAAAARFRPPDVVAPQPSHEALAVAMAQYLEVMA